MKPAVVIVTYNSGDSILRCLDGALQYANDIVVVDNASADGTRDQVRGCPGVRLIANAENRGFAGAVNQGIAAVENELVLLLNPDAFLDTPLDGLVNAFHDPGVGAAAGMLTNDDGSPQAGFTVRRFPTPATLSFEALGLNRIWPGNPVNRRYRCHDLDLESEADVEQPAGAFLMIRRDVWRELGGLEESFHPIWFEDVDYLRRLVDKGFRVRYVPSVKARHTGGHSIRTLTAGCRTQRWYGSLLKYAVVHFGPVGCWVVCVNVAFGAVLRMGLGVLSQRCLEPIAVYGEVLRTAGRVFFTGRVQGRGNAAP